MDLKKKLRFWLATWAWALLLGALSGMVFDVQAQAPPTPKEPENDLRYATEQPANSGFAFEAHTTSSWDDNILGDNAHRVGDYLFQEGGLLDFWTKHPGWSVELGYRPNAVLYKTYNGLNQLDHRLDFTNEFHLASHLLFRLKDSLDLSTGVLEPQANQDVSLPTGGTSLNTTLLAPFARQFANQALGEAEYDVSRRGTFRFSGAHGFRRFTNAGTSSTVGTNVAANLFNTQSDVGSASYDYRLTRHFTGGIVYEFENYRFGQAFHDKTQSGFLRVLWEVRPHVSFSVFGGGQFSDSNGLFATPSTNPAQPGTVLTPIRGKAWGPGGGGSVTLRSDQTVFRFSAQRLVADGGGLLAGVTNSFEAAEIRRRILWRWDAALTVSNSRSEALEGVQGKAALDTQAAGITLERPLAAGLSMHLEYNYLRQRANSFTSFPINLDRNRFTLGFFYRPHGYEF